jgi:hypothetical protein
MSRVPDLAEVERMGYAHGRDSASSVERRFVSEAFPRWSDGEIDAYLEARRRGADEVLDHPLLTP